MSHILLTSTVHKTVSLADIIIFKPTSARFGERQTANRYST